MSKLFWPHCEIGCLKHCGSFLRGSCVDLDEKKKKKSDLFRWLECIVMWILDVEIFKSRFSSYVWV